MVWLKSEYMFASMFSYRVPNYSPSFALTSPIPGPSTVKLAIISTAIERNGVSYGEKIFNIIRDSGVLVEPPDKIALSKALIKRLKQDVIAKKMPKDKKETGICVICNESKDVWKIDNVLVCKDCSSNRISQTFGIREYAHFSGPLNIFIDVKNEKNLIIDILKRIKYFGTSDSLVFCKSVSEQVPDENACVKCLESLSGEGSVLLGDLALLLADFKKDISFKDINPYEKVRNRDPYLLSSYVFPIKLEREGKNWVIYSKIKTS